MNILVTAGATREFLDPVRFISNPSSGRMGVKIAEAAKKRGHNVILVVGCCTVNVPDEMPIVMGTTALEMRKMIRQYLDWADVLVMNAAVGDWRMKKVSKQKIKKEAKTLTLKLTANPDILAEIGKLKKRGKKIFLVGFSVDTESLINNAKKKLKKKNLDLIIANPIDTFGSTGAGVTIINRNGEITKLALFSKKQLAGKLVRLIEKACPPRNSKNSRDLVPEIA